MSAPRSASSASPDYTPASDADALDLQSVTQVAALLGLRYAKARDAILQGKLGAIHWRGPRMLIPKNQVLEYQRRIQEKKARGQ
jgi:excisionase family DNA binding protein